MTVMSDVIEAMMEVVRGVNGIRAAPDYAPESMSVFPFAIGYPASGSFKVEPAGVMTGLHDLVIELHVARRDLSRDIQDAIPYVDSISEALLDDTTLGGVISTFGGIRYQFGPLGWNGIETIGWRFWLENVKVHTTL